MAYRIELGAHTARGSWVGCSIHRLHGVNMDVDWAKRRCTLCPPDDNRTGSVCACPCDGVRYKKYNVEHCFQCPPCAICDPKITDEELRKSVSFNDFNLDDLKI